MLQAEARVLRVSLDCAREARDKLRQDLQDSNHRTVLLAQEVDEQFVWKESEDQRKIQVRILSTLLLRNVQPFGTISEITEY